MQQLLEKIKELYTYWKGMPPFETDILPQSGSERVYFRLYDKNNETVIGAYGANKKENETFFYFTKIFSEKKLTVPKILAISDDNLFYLQEDVGNESLLNILEKEGQTDKVFQLFKKSLQQLVQLQIKGNELIDYNKCLTSREFGRKAIEADLLYFKYYFLDILKHPYDKQKLLDDFEALANYVTHTENKFFMFRDFQSRNILLKKKKICFIDYQGGMKGAPQYDVASLLWQAKANLSQIWKNDLFEEYMNAFEKSTQTPLNRMVFKSQYNGYVLIRLLQVLGAYGFRGLFERKAHFLSSLPLALHNLKEFLKNNEIGILLLELNKVLAICTSDEVVKKFTPPKANDNTLLEVTVCSFSFRNALPKDESGNGGGFIFDCRGIANPGRIEMMKTQTGRDKNVKEYLERESRMYEFLNSAYDMVDISVEEYMRRGFTHLLVSFGCTGGQHRSVYAADAMARHLKNKYHVKIKLQHIEQERKNWINNLTESRN